jgi:hypothetical protein
MEPAHPTPPHVTARPAPSRPPGGRRNPPPLPGTPLRAGNKISILAGDFLLARASVTLASLQDPVIVELLSRVLEHLVTGEVRPVTPGCCAPNLLTPSWRPRLLCMPACLPRDPDARPHHRTPPQVMQMSAAAEQLSNLDYYLEKTFCKTASLMANSARATALLGGAAPPVADLAWQYGRHLGLAFQIVDDILDLTGRARRLLGRGAAMPLAGSGRGGWWGAGEAGIFWGGGGGGGWGGGRGPAPRRGALHLPARASAGGGSVRGTSPP